MMVYQLLSQKDGKPFLPQKESVKWKMTCSDTDELQNQKTEK